MIVLDSEGEYAAYCGMWYDQDSEYGIVEPLATIPKCRKMGLGRAVVYDGIKRCRNLEVKSVFAGSSQQFLLFHWFYSLWKQNLLVEEDSVSIKYNV